MEFFSVINYEYPNEFNRDAIITADDFISVVWTERFIEAGEVQIVLPAEHKQLKLLAPGGLIGLRGSQELMLLETRTIENGLATATGKTIEAFFNNRFLPHESLLGQQVMAARGGDILKSIVNYMQNWNMSYKNVWGYNQQWFFYDHRLIADLSAASPDPAETGPIRTVTVPPGPVYDTLVNLAKKYKIGQSVLWSPRPSSELRYSGGSKYKLIYTTRQGKDRTASVRLSTDLENLGDPKQLLSIAGSKNYVAVIPPKWIFTTAIDVPSLKDSLNWVMWNLPGNELSAFGRRYMTIDCTDLTLAKLGAPASPKTTADYYPAIQKMYDIIRTRQEGALNEHKRTKMIDGEITPASRYVYKKDYDLGDIVSVQGDFGDPLHGVITEYIRTQDETGERQYPTMSTDSEVLTDSSTPKNIAGDTGV